MNWLGKHFDSDPLGDLASEDYIAHRIREVLTSDASKLIEIVGSVGVVGIYSPISFERFPQYLIATGIVDEDPGVGSLEDKVTIYHVFRFTAQRPELLQSMAPGLASFWRYVRLVMMREGNMLLNTARPGDGKIVQLAKRSVPGRVSTSLEGETESSSFAFRSVLPWEYELTLDTRTQRIRNLTA